MYCSAIPNKFSPNLDLAPAGVEMVKSGATLIIMISRMCTLCGAVTLLTYVCVCQLQPLLVKF